MVVLGFVYNHAAKMQVGIGFFIALPSFVFETIGVLQTMVTERIMLKLKQIVVEQQLH